MASLVSTLPAPPAATTSRGRLASVARPSATAFLTTQGAVGLKFAPRISQIPVAKSRKSTRISCAAAEPETLQVVQNTIAKQLSIDEGSVTPQTKFADLGADSLDTVEIMMALEEKFGVSIGEGGAENIATVQDAADLIEKVKATAS
ncbi:Acyl carrier protein 1, chloroplastic [Sesamum alatum]|uniref:Acyl carrier protein n=1 Tax=Sesamum alatum TaxID=300844 RepID=A0AAE1XZH5_9LAMI|nr:Acyl carrier protein 1, chloroplastic [Sesamum alatum]